MALVNNTPWALTPKADRSFKHFLDDPFRVTARTAGGEEYPVASIVAALTIQDLMRLDFVAPGLSLSFPATVGSRVTRQRRSFRPPAFSDYPWRIDETGWVRYLTLCVDGLEARVYADGHIDLGVA